MSVGSEDRRLAELVADRLGGRRVAVAESCTAGRLAAALASVEFASEFFCGGVTAYQERVKREVLDVRTDTVLSEAAATEMAVGVAGLLGAEVALATTGVAGADEVDGVAPGTVFVATVIDGVARAATLKFDGDPDDVCDDATDQALKLLAAHLLDDGA